MSVPVKYPTIIQNVVTALALTKGNPVTIQDKFPKGPGYYAMLLGFHITFTNTTGTTPLAQALLNFLKNINFKSDKEGVVVNGNGMTLWERAHKVNGTLSYQSTLAATAGTYDVYIPINFANPALRRPEDLILDSARTTQFDLSVTCGDVADLLSSVGDSVITAVTMDVNIVTTVGPVNASTAPIAVPYMNIVGPVDPSVMQYLDIERNVDLAVLDLTVITANSVTAGIPASGTLADTVLTSLQFEDNFAIPFRSIPFIGLTVKNKLDYQYETKKTGVAIIDFTQDGSLYSSYPTGNKARAQITWVNKTLSTSAVTAFLDGWKKLKA
jgi:hypothetical protein